jgi:hypothetical protein
MSIGVFTNKNLLPVQRSTGVKKQRMRLDTQPEIISAARVHTWFLWGV